MSAHHLTLEIPQTVLTRIDGRVKLLLSLCGLMAAVSTRTWQLPASFGLTSLAALVGAGVPVRLVAQRLRPVVFIAVLLWFTQIFLTGQTPTFQWDFGWVHLTGYEEGLIQGRLYAVRVLGGMSVMLLLTLSTSVQEWVSALAWFKVPATVIEIMTLSYSSLFVLMEELDRLQKAQRMRLGYGSWWRTVQTTSTIGGVLFLRVFERSRSLWEAMLCRGYEGEMRVNYLRTVRRGDIALAVAGLSIIIFAWVMAR